MDCHDPSECREIWNDFREVHNVEPMSGSVIVMHEPATSMVYGLEKDAQTRWYQQQIEHERTLRYEGKIAALQAFLAFWRVVCGILAVVVLWLVTRK